MKHSNGNRSSFTGILGGLAVGALAMYIFDPVHGNRRRSEMLDKINSMKAGTRSRAQQKSRDVRPEPEGSGAGTWSTGSSGVAGETASTAPTAGEMSQSSSAP